MPTTNKLPRSEKSNTAATLICCTVIAAALCYAQISGSRILLAGCLAIYLLFHLWECEKGNELLILLFFLPWSPLLKFGVGSISFFTLALLVTCLYCFAKCDFRLEAHQTIAVVILLVTTLIAKLLQGNSISNSYLFFFLMLFLYPCVAKCVSEKSDFSALTLFFACGIITAAISAQQVASYHNISQYITVDSYLTITRLSGYYGDPNFYSAHITACLAGVQCILCSEKSKLRRIIWWAIFVLLIYCGMLSASKSFVIVFACQFLIWIPIILVKRNIGNKFALIAGIVCASIVLFSSSAVQDLLLVLETRFSYNSNLSDITTGRTDLWLRYWNEFTHDGLLTILGNGYSEYVTLYGRASHNTIIQGIFQFGIIAFPFLIAWFVHLIKRFDSAAPHRIKFKYVALMAIGIALPWMALDILFFDEFFLLPVYGAIGAAHASKQEAELTASA